MTAPTIGDQIVGQRVGGRRPQEPYSLDDSAPQVYLQSEPLSIILEHSNFEVLNLSYISMNLVAYLIPKCAP